MSNKSKKQDIYCNSFNKYRTRTGYIVFILIILSIIYVYKSEKKITSIGHNNIKFTNTCIINKKLSHSLKICTNHIIVIKICKRTTEITDN